MNGMQIFVVSLMNIQYHLCYVVMVLSIIHSYIIIMFTRMDDIVEMVVVGEGEGGIPSTSESVEVTHVSSSTPLHTCTPSGASVFCGQIYLVPSFKAYI